jgi:hypothetical protein
MARLYSIETVVIFWLIMWLFNRIGGFDQRGGIKPEIKNFVNWVVIVVLIFFIAFR